MIIFTFMTRFSKTILLSISCLQFSLYCAAQSLERYRTLKDTAYTSTNLAYKKHIQITVPVEYQDNLPQNFPLIIVFDMQNQRQYQYLLKSIDYLTANEQMPSAVIVGVEAGKGSYRYQETQFKLSDTAGMAEKNEDYIFKELIPMMREKFKSGVFTMLIGHSRYGFLTSYLLAKHARDLSAVISISPFMKQPRLNLAELLPQEIEKSKLDHEVYYRYAMGNDYPQDYKELTQALKTSNFKAQHFNADGWWFPEADHNTTPALMITRSIYEIFAYWYSCQSQYLSEDNKNIQIIEELKQKIASHYGAPLSFSLGILNGKGYAFYNKKDYPNAILAWQQLVKQYPNFIQGYLNIAECQKALKQPIEETIKEFNSQIDKSTIFTKEQKTDFIKEAEKM